jgi:hypothetical protein
VDNCPTVPNPSQADTDQDGTGDACEPVPVTVTIKVLEQDIRADFPTWAQHRQQPTTRLGFRGSGKYRSLGRIDLSVIPPGAIIDNVLLVYWTTSGNPGAVGPNGDVANEGATITVELKKMLKAWNYDEPFTYPASFSDNDTPATTGETSWNNSLFPPPGSSRVRQDPRTACSWPRWGRCPTPIDTRFDFTSPALVPLVQGWLDVPSTNHGYLLKAPNSQEFGPVANRKILCGKGFPWRPRPISIRPRRSRTGPRRGSPTTSREPARRRRPLPRPARRGCFVLPNPWDVGTALHLAHLGFQALATTSAGFAFSRGLPDDPAALPCDGVLAHVREIVQATPLPVNADFQSGYADTPEGVADSVARCVGTGCAGLSIEDASGDPASPLFPLDVALARLRAAREAIDASRVPVVLTRAARRGSWGSPIPPPWPGRGLPPTPPPGPIACTRRACARPGRSGPWSASSPPGP